MVTGHGRLAGRLIEAGHWQPADPDILVVFDSGYDLTPAGLAAARPARRGGGPAAQQPGDVLPGPAAARTAGRDGRAAPPHGAVLKLADERTWPALAVAAGRTTTANGRLTPARVRRGYRSIRQVLPDLASPPKPGKPGPGRPPGSKNHRTATRHDVGKTAKREKPKKKEPRQEG
jgi:hypothetical protein